MGMLDTGLVFAEGQAVTNTGDTPSTNVYEAANANLGGAGMTGENLWVQAICSAPATSGGNATVQAVLQDSADGVNYTDQVAGPAVAVANVTAGTPLLQVQPPPGLRQYWRIVWRVATAALTAGAFDAYITNTLERNVPQPSGFSVA